jgi:hypothetical protein
VAEGLLRLHVIVLIPVVLSYHLRTSATFALSPAEGVNVVLDGVKNIEDSRAASGKISDGSVSWTSHRK